MRATFRAFRTAGPRLFGVLLLGWGLGALALALWPVPTGAGAARDNAVQWLHLPAFLIVAALIPVVLESWPPYCKDRPGVEVLLRLHRHRLQGCGAAALGGFAAAALALVGVTLLFSLTARSLGLSPPLTTTVLHPAVVGHISVVPGRPAVLAMGGGGEVDALVLRPIFILPPAGTTPDGAWARLRVAADGTPLHPDTLDLDPVNDQITLPFEPREVSELTVSSDAGAVSFTRERILLRGSTERSFLANALLAGAVYLLPAAAALAALLMFRGLLSFGVALALGEGLLLVQCLAGWTPVEAAITALAGGRWVTGTLETSSFLPSLSLVVAAAIGAAIPRRDFLR